MNSDASVYGGSGCGNMGGVTAEDMPFHGKDFSAEITLPPLSCTVFVKDAPLDGAQISSDQDE